MRSMAKPFLEQPFKLYQFLPWRNFQKCSREISMSAYQNNSWQCKNISLEWLKSLLKRAKYSGMEISKLQEIS